MYAMCIINYNCVFARLFDDGLLYLIIDFVRLAYNVLYYYPGIYIYTFTTRRRIKSFT